MDKLKRFIDCYIPTETCNLRCHYCYIAQKRKFNNKLASFSNSKEVIRKALSKKRLGGVCLLNLCAGGETLLSEEVLDVVYELLLEGHYVMVVTNGTLTQRFEQLVKWPKEIKERLFIKASFHYLELKRIDMLERFKNNIHLLKDNGVSFTIEVTPSDELIPYIDELKEYCMKNFGAYCHITIARDDRKAGIDILSELDFEEYKKTWSSFESTMFDFKSEIFYKKRKEFCYAGEWSAYLNLETGDLKQCYCGKVIDNIYEDINRPIHFDAIGYGCTIPHCYNGHAFLTLGNIPELETPYYFETRNRECEDGTEWLFPKVKAFMSQKLIDNNEEYSIAKKLNMKIKYIGEKKYRRLRRVAGKAKRKVVK